MTGTRGGPRSKRSAIAPVPVRVALVALGVVISMIGWGSSGAAAVAGARPAIPTVAPGPPASAPCGYDTTIDAFVGAYGSASEIGWAGNGQGVVTCLGGSFYVQDGIDRAFGFGIYPGGPTSWTDADGYLPAQITTFHRRSAAVVITEFADQVTVQGHAFVAVYCRVTVTNTGGHLIDADPGPTAGLLPLDAEPDSLGPHLSSTHDYVMAVDRFGNTYPWPSPTALVEAGGFDLHFAHMRAFWDGQLATIAEVHVPVAELDDAYRSGFISTQIARSGTHLDTGVNGYESEYSHDVVGILANLFTQGYFENAHALLKEEGNAVDAPGQYPDGVWTYSWPWAIYLLKTGDLAFVRSHFAAAGAAGSGPSIEGTAHQIAAARTGPDGIIGMTDDIDTNGYWTVDDYEALMGLASYRYLATQVGDGAEARWATRQYDSLLAATNRVLNATIHRFHLTYLPCSMVQPDSANRCANPEDANWAAPFLFGRWAWDAPLFGAPVDGPGLELIDATYSFGFGRLQGILPRNTFGGYPSDYFSTAYDAGYGSWGLASRDHRDQGILGYEFMLTRTQSGPYSWWESASAPSRTPWVGSHPATGQGAAPTAWGLANANKVLLDSLAAQESDGTLIVGRGVPDAWVQPGMSVSVTDFPTTRGQRLTLSITAADKRVSLAMRGPANGPVLFQVPAFVDNIAAETTGTVDQTTGTVELAPGDEQVTVQLRHTPR